MIQQERPEELVTFSSHSVSFQTLYEIGYWQKNIVSDDSRIFWNAYIAYNGGYTVTPMAYPVSMDANLAPTFLETCKNVYKQHRRWMWGAENVPYLLFSFIKNKKIQLKKELGRVPGERGILAHVITVPRRSFYDTFVIDAGSVEGVSIGQHVFAFDSIAVGVVTGLDTHNATVELYSAPGRETTGTATGNNVAVTLIGRGGGEYEVHLPRDVHFDIKESIAYQSTTSAILAQIEKITTDPRDPFQRLLAKAPVNLNALKWVIVK
jgi:hypothetical protein